MTLNQLWLFSCLCTDSPSGVRKKQEEKTPKIFGYEIDGINDTSEKINF